MTSSVRRRSRGSVPPDDREIDAATGEGRAANLDSAYPNPDGPDDRILPDVMNGDDSPVPPANVVDGLSARLDIVSTGGGDYAYEYKLKMLHRMLLRDIPLDVIARTMSCSVTEVKSLRRELFRRLKREAGNIDMMTHAGRTLSFYDEVRGTALKMAASARHKTSDRIRSLSVALQAEGDKHSFLSKAGFYDTARFQPKTDAEDDAAKDATTLGEIARAMLDPHADMSAIQALEQEDMDEPEYDAEDGMHLL